MIPLDKIRGGLLGVCLGDALGTPHEFSRNVPYTGILQHRVTVRSRFQPNREGPPGQVSDDATMTIALLWQILTDKDWILDHVISEYLHWANQSSAFLGKNTRELLHGIKTISGFWNRYNRIDLSNRQSNGSLMRAYPLILLMYYQPETCWVKAISDTSLTNPNPVNKDSTLVYLLMIRSVLEGKSATESIPGIIQQSQTPVVREALSQALNRTIRMIDGPDKGWVVHALYMAARAWLMTDLPGTTFSDVMEWVISRGGDCDTNAAISGGLVGTFYGESGLRSDSVTSQNIQILLTSNPQTGQIPYDMRYHPSTGLSLIS